MAKIANIREENVRDLYEDKPVTARHGKSAVFQASREKAKLTSKLLKKETIGGIVTETYEKPDGSRWLFAYRSEDHVISSALEAVKSTRLAESIDL